MSEKYGDNKLAQTPKHLTDLSTMGNLFSKEGLEQDSETDLKSKEELLTSNLLTPTMSIVGDSESYLNLFDKTPLHDTLCKGTDTQIIESEKVILNAFLNEVRNAKPVPLKNWSALQHYIYFIYRHAISAKPCNSNEIFPNIITKKIRELVDSLLQEDLTQLCIRLVTLVREYAVIARGHFDSFRYPKTSSYLISLMSYYSAFCSAASKLGPLLPEFDFLIMERFNVNFLCLNKSIFYHYIYMSPGVQRKLPLFNKFKEEGKSQHKNLLESFDCFKEDMSQVATRWATLKFRISALTQKRTLSNPSKHLVNDWKMFEEQKKILKTNYWMIRNTQAMQIQDMSELDAHILSLVGDTATISDFLIDPQGHCLCEDCLAAEFKSSSMSSAMPSSLQAQSSAVCRLITCYICQDPIALDALASHIVTKHHDCPNQKPTKVYLTPHQKRLFCPKKSAKVGDVLKLREAFPFDELFDKNNELKESILKIVHSQTSKSNSEKDSVESTHQADEDIKLQNESKESTFQYPKKIFKETIFNSTENEELKHKPANSSCRTNDVTFPFKLSTSPIYQGSDVSSFKTIKEPIFKIATEAPVMPSGSDIMFKGASKSNEDVQSCKAVLDEFLKKRNETVDVQTSKSSLHECLKWKSTDIANRKATEVLKKSAELFSSKDVPKTVGEVKTCDETSCKNPNTSIMSHSSTNEGASFRKPQQKATVESKMLEFFKNNSNGQKSPLNTSAKSNDNSCIGHACGHKCKQDDDKQAELKKFTCVEGCEHQRDSRKCDCAYCEVFGASFPQYPHKGNETRDRLRTRLNQRKEKVNDGVSKGSLKGTSLIGINITTNKGNIKPTIEPESCIPPRVPEVVHPVPPPVAPKMPVASTETKKLVTINKPTPIVNIQKVPINRQIPVSSTADQTTSESSSTSISISSLSSDIVDSRDINELLNYIEGNKSVDKVALAQKKADKKARQRMKKTEERERLEREKQLKEQIRIKEEKRKEEERIKAEMLAKQLLEKRKKKKNLEDSKAPVKSETKKLKKKTKQKTEVPKIKESEVQKNLIEETIPAMVTIKRVEEGNNSPATVTITLKGSTPESDKLLFTLVNGHNSKENFGTARINAEVKAQKSLIDNIVKPKPQSSASDKTNTNSSKVSKKKKKIKDTKEVKDVRKELKVTIAVDKKTVNKEDISKKPQKQPVINKPEFKCLKTNKKSDIKVVPPKPTAIDNKKEDVTLPMLRLPPGITITKIEGPPANRNCKATNSNTLNHTNQSTHVPVSKSGVIVVDTEKLIQQSITANNIKKNKKKNRKKKDSKSCNEINEITTDKGSTNKGGTPMVTLKNPIFHTLQSTLCNKATEPTDLPVFSNNQQASIFKNENGMVTIRSPRLQNPFENGSPISNFLTDLKPMFGSEVPSYMPICHTNYLENNKKASLNAQEILSGLPGIEITKVDKSNSKNDTENKKASQPAEVSIIPTNNSTNNSEKFYFDKDDWPYDVFTPRDVLEEDMDAEERELEAFKRFCQQSIPPERKEKVAHLNVKDIILKKKTDVTYS